MKATDQIYLTSDPHFGHKAMLHLANRPYDSVEEMDQAIIDNFNAIPEHSILIILGDFAWTNPKQYVDRIKRKKVLIPGNHDFKRPGINKLYRAGFDQVVFDLTLKQTSEYPSIFCSHYAHIVWNISHWGSYHAFGHSHGNLPICMPRSYDVGLDGNNMQPLHISEFIDKCDNNPKSIHLLPNDGLIQKGGK